MADAIVQNYQGAGAPEVIIEGYDTYIKVFNETGAALTEGSVVKVSPANSTSGIYPSAVQPATQAAVVHIIGVVNNAKLGVASIANLSYGFVQVAGYCPKIATAGAVTTVDHQLVTTNTSYAATSSGATTESTSSFASAKSTVGGAGFVSGWLTGRLIAMT